MRKILPTLSLLFSVVLPLQPAFAEEALTVYSSRKEELIKPIFEQFTKETGIKVQFLNDEAPKLIARLASEGDATPADMLVTAEIANMEIASGKGLLQPLESKLLEKNIPAHFRDDGKQWFGLSKRVRAIMYNKDAVKPSELSTYEDLAKAKWKGELLARSSAHPYNQSLLANIISVHGAEAAQQWANGFAANLARNPQGGDVDQIRAVAAGEAKLAIANSYYYGRMLRSNLPEDALVKEKVGIFFPNQKPKQGELAGAHVNISAGAITKYAKNRDGAQKLLEFLSSAEAQRMYADINTEYPVNPAVKPNDLLKGWGSFKADSTPLSALAEHAAEATRIADTAGWK